MSEYKAFIDTSAILRLLTKDDEGKSKAVEKLIKESGNKRITLYLLPVTVLEIVWVLEKVYKFDRKTIREIVEATLNTPQLKCYLENVFRKSLLAYETQNIKFADAVMGYWGIEEGLSTVYTYDEKDFRKIEGLNVLRP